MDDAIRLLVVDDEEVLLRAMARLLRKRALMIFTEQDPRRALQMISDARIEIIVSDFAMPLMTGIELLREAKLAHPQMLAVLMSGSTEREPALDGMRAAGVDRFLEKPWAPGEIQLLFDDLEAAVQLQRAFAKAESSARRSPNPRADHRSEP